MNLLIILKMMINQVKKLNIGKFLTLIISRGGYKLSLFIFITTITTCGIAVYYYLNPPVNFTTLSFYHAYNNNPDYALGYDFFYRIYDGVSTTESTVKSEANTFFTETNLLELLFSNRNIISNNFFKRILPISDNKSTDYHLSDDIVPTVSSPIMTIDPAYFDKDDSSKIFTVSFNILTSTTGYGSITTTGYTPSGSYPTWYEFGRYVTSNSSNFEIKTFLDIDESYDDVPELDGSNTINIAFFVVLYGRTENFVPIFSDVVYIGSVNNLTF